MTKTSSRQNLFEKHRLKISVLNNFKMFREPNLKFSATCKIFFQLMFGTSKNKMCTMHIRAQRHLDRRVTFCSFALRAYYSSFLIPLHFNLISLKFVCVSSVASLFLVKLFVNLKQLLEEYYCYINYIDKRSIMERLSWGKTNLFTSSKELAAASFRSKRTTRSKKVLIRDQ